MAEHPESIITCINKRDGSVVKVGTATRMIGPTLVDPFHLMLGAGCGEWGICIFLNLTDAAKLHSELEHVLADQSLRG